jgi:hypothetical protein
MVLVIRPTLIFSTYSGSTADNFGYTATYDSKGYAYAAGSVFHTRAVSCDARSISDIMGRWLWLQSA